jgi:hypothetical protein
MTDKKDKRYDYIIYKLCSDNCDDSYIGSTRNITQRKKSHKSNCNNPKSKEYNQKNYQTIRDNGGWDEWRLCPIELMKNTTKFEAECQEEVVRMRLKAMLNSQKASCGGVSKQLYDKQHYEENKEHKKKYRENNKQKICEKFDCECGGRFTHGDKSKHFKTQKHQKYVDSLENET